MKLKWSLYRPLPRTEVIKVEKKMIRKLKIEYKGKEIDLDSVELFLSCFEDQLTVGELRYFVNR